MLVVLATFTDRDLSLAGRVVLRTAAGPQTRLLRFEQPLLRARTSDGRGFTVGERRGTERLVRVDGRQALLRIPAAAIEGAIHLFRGVVPSAAKMTPATIAPNTSPTTVLLFCA